MEITTDIHSLAAFVERHNLQPYISIMYAPRTTDVFVKDYSNIIKNEFDGLTIDEKTHKLNLLLEIRYSLSSKYASEVHRQNLIGSYFNKEKYDSELQEIIQNALNAPSGGMQTIINRAIMQKFINVEARNYYYTYSGILFDFYDCIIKLIDPEDVENIDHEEVIEDSISDESYDIEYSDSDEDNKTEIDDATPKNIFMCPSNNETPVYCNTREDYLRQSRIFHPDKNKGCIDDATIKFQILENLCKKGGFKKRKTKIRTRTRTRSRTRKNRKNRQTRNRSRTRKNRKNRKTRNRK
jgi:nitrogen regulatory protein PII-like uncharacterized protein